MTPPAAAVAAPARRSPADSARQEERALWILVALGVALALAIATVRGPAANLILAAFAVPLTLVAFQRTLLAWQSLLGLILLVILFVPIRRYTISLDLPFELEPYRILISAVLVCWLCALAADPQLRWRRTGLEAPTGVFILAILGSLALNIGRVNSVNDIVIKQVTFFIGFFLVAYFIASVIRKGRDLDRMLRVLVAGGTLLAILSLIEWRTGSNLFNWLHNVIPFLQYVDLGEHIERGTGVRALGSAQHPIALGAALVMLIPLTVYLHRRDNRFAWLICGALLTLGAFATGSRTVALMLIVLLISFLWIKREETVKLLPWLLPLFLVCQIAMPGTLGTFKALLRPSYVIQEQSNPEGTGSGRIADLGPSLSEWSRKPFLGQGFGTRVTSQQEGAPAAQILDNQWLSSLLEIGAVGVLGLIWLFARAIRRLARRARSSLRSDADPDGWLATGLAASLAAYAVGMLTYDAFSFIQVTFFAFIMLGFMAVLTGGEDEEARGT